MVPSFICGRNFSGRTAHLRQWIKSGLAIDPGASLPASIYLGPDASSALSGIAASVSSEVALMAATSESAMNAMRALTQLGFEHIAARNPFTLSGGEQVIAALVAAAACCPSRLAIDCTLEQLTPSTRRATHLFLAKLYSQVMLVDNRWREWLLDATPLQELGVPDISDDIGVPREPQRAVCTGDLVLRDIWFRYPKGPTVLRGLNLRLCAGGRYVLNGPNGSGKTTLSKILCGLLKPSAGKISFSNTEIHPWRRPGDVCCYHFQNPDCQLFGSTVSAQFRPITPDRFATLDRFGLRQVAAVHPLDLCFVLRKRVALAATLARSTPVAILDEPTLGQDDEFVDRLISSFAGQTIIVISHSERFRSFETLPIGALQEPNRWPEQSPHC